MSSDEAADNREDPGHLSFIIMRDTETFDGQERVMSRAAYDLQVLATSHSASCGHPGFVPDDYLEHLDGLAIETTITAAELCTAGMWERVDGGYRVLDWEAVEVCLDQVRQRWGEDEQALAWEREREALVQAQMAQAMVVTPPEPPQRASSSLPLDAFPPSGNSGPALCRTASSGSASRDSGTRCSKASLPATATATPLTPAGPAGSPRRSGFLCPSPRSTAPASMTMQDSARTATPRIATSTGTYRRAAMVTALAAMARAWIRTGRHRMDPVDDSAYYEDLAGRLYGLVITFSDTAAVVRCNHGVASA